MITYSIWNNKGGTGKTSLTFQSVCRFADQQPDKKVLVIDMCPQANLSELLLGGQENNGSQNLLDNQSKRPRCSIGGYFDSRLGSPFFAPEDIYASDYVCTPNDVNQNIPENIDLVCGDPLLELQAIAMNSLANNDIPGINPWLSVIDWVNVFLENVEYDCVFIDTNPSFSMYTQIALAASDRVILPVMADDSSRRAIQNAFSLIYGLKLPSEVYSNYTFAKKMQDNKRDLPKIDLVIKNRLTQYMGPASAYEAVLRGIDKDLDSLVKQYPQHFNFSSVEEGIVQAKDFGTTGVVAFATGCPFYNLSVGKRFIGGADGLKVTVNKSYKEEAMEHIDGIVEKLR